MYQGSRYFIKVGGIELKISQYKGSSLKVFRKRKKIAYILKYLRTKKKGQVEEGDVCKYIPLGYIEGVYNSSRQQQ